MSVSQKFIVLPFRKGRRGALISGEMRQATTAASAERIADAMASRFAGVSAFAVNVDAETGDMTEPQLLRSHGETIDIMAQL